MNGIAAPAYPAKFFCTVFILSYIFALLFLGQAQMAKLVDAPSSGGGAARCAGSNPVLGTKKWLLYREPFLFDIDGSAKWILIHTN